jgi:8-oxo-dGTP pyrophosphatase MutT (NUDIX family)
VAISPYLKRLRERVGRDLVQLPSVAVMTFDDRGRLLLVRSRDTGEWQTVGGAIDPDESPADAAVREAFEETGLEVDLVRVTGVYGGPLFRLTYPNGDVCSYTAIVFEARVVGGSARPDGEETTETGWFAQAEAAGLAMAPHTRLLVAEAFRRDPAARFDAPGWRPGP